MLVLPSRIIVALFFIVLLGMPLISRNPYLIRVIILTSIFAILAASWDLLSGFTGQMNFGHALFFGVGAYTSALLNIHLHIPPWGSVPLGAVAAVLAGLDRRDPLSPAETHLPGPDHHGLSDYFVGDRFCPARFDRRRVGDFRIAAHFQLPRRQLLHLHRDHARSVHRSCGR